MLEIYDQMFDECVPTLLSGSASLDPFLLDLEADKRLGISLVIPLEIDFSPVIEALKLIEPEQYFYPSTDWHITLQVIATCTAPFSLEEHPIDRYIQGLHSVLQQTEPFTIHFKGITASSAAVVAQGFCEDLAEVRLKTHAVFASLGLTIHERYFPKTAHSTLMRFCHPLRDPRKFVDTLKTLRNFSLGQYTATRICLNRCDWYNRQEKRKELARFSL